MNGSWWIGRISAIVLALLFSTISPPANTEDAPKTIDAPLWLRYPAISPDGKTIAFIFHGHLFTVPSSGGIAKALTSGTSHETAPVWSPNGKSIAFASDLHGNYDVYVIDADGGAQKRLTAYSADDIPTAFTPDGQSVLFSSHRTDTRTSAKYPANFLPELYQVPVAEGLSPTLVLSTPALGAHYDRSGQHLLYEDVKGVEDIWRKHETFANAHKLFVYDVRKNSFTQLPGYQGENRNPQWAPDQTSIFFLSEQSGSFNVWRQALAKGAAAKQITHFTKNPVRFLTVADDGTLCFGFDGEIYTLPAGSTLPVKLSVAVPSGDTRQTNTTLHLKSDATEMALSPTGREMAFIVRGDVYVVSTETGATRRITNTPAQERGIAFSPDGRHLAFAAEYGRPWSLYEASLGKPEDTGFVGASAIDIHPLLENDKDNQQPRYSPDGKEVAFLENRATLKVLNLATKTTRLILPGDVNYSVEDGDQWFDWSPDGKRFLVNFLDLNRWSRKAGLIDASGRGTLLNLAASGFEEIKPRWSPDGRALIWISDKFGLHGAGYDADFDGDVLEMFLSQNAFDRFNLSSAEAKTTPAPTNHPAESLELEDRDDRTVRLTLGSSNVVDAQLTPDGEQLIYAARGATSVELWSLTPRDKNLHRLASVSAKPGDDAPVSVSLTSDGKTAYLLATGKTTRVNIASDTVTPVAFDAEKQIDGMAERAWLFDHVWRLEKAKFFDAEMNGVDWDYYRTVYSRFLPFIDNDEDFAEMCSEMVGELNASHLGCRYKRESSDETAALGAFYDPDYHGPGLKIQEVIEKGPLSGAAIAPGTIIERIDAQAIPAGCDPSLVLNHKAGKRIVVDLIDPMTQQRRQITVKPITLAEEQDLLYARWVKHQREEVDRLSGGQVGYVHLKAMNNRAYRDMFDDVFGRDGDKPALLIDTRYNHGGHMRDDLITLLSGKRYLHYVPRGRSIGWDPVAPVGKWAGKTTLLVNEDNYSDGHLFPWVYQHLQLGKLVGMPVPGTGTSAFRETEQNPRITIGVPHGAVEDTNSIVMERVQIEPDIRVANNPASLAKGQDLQLERAVQLLKDGK
ncbi:S41 family peptidase [Dyella acidisoli]|uniref:Tricorn protease homolog n=1 Tax=Dyella acidisoli TaxID=1867834 RepID=A0ABQ5XP53_9GAMM|nr:S41 family peptidase [Dyella acidisoli]GLQ92964.1 tricorn protease [Dyella acidisoli]